jgi:alpha-L-rhamnosidase
MDKLYVSSLTCEYRQNPLGIDICKPRISWQIQSNRRGTMQLAYQYQVSLTKDNFDHPLWDTAYTKSDQSLHIPYEGPELTSRTRYYYRVKVWDNFGTESDWSSVSWWETAFLDASEWKADWITPNPQELDPTT